MLARLVFCIVFALASLVSFSAAAQSTWKLTNISNQTLKFDTFDPARGTWKQQSIYPHQPVSYSMNADSGKFRIATTNRGFVEYQVRAGGQYTLGWDAGKGVWDLKRVAGAQPANPANPVAQGAHPSYELHNLTNQTLSFETLDPARNTWKVHTAYPNERKAMSFLSGLRDGKIRVATKGRGFVQYDVHAGWKYSLQWDQAKGVWDFRTVHRGS